MRLVHGTGEVCRMCVREATKRGSVGSVKGMQDLDQAHKQVCTTERTI